MFAAALDIAFVHHNLMTGCAHERIHTCAPAHPHSHTALLHRHTRTCAHTKTFACNTHSGPHIQAFMHVQRKRTTIPALDVHYKRIATGHWVCCIKVSYLLQHVSKRVHHHLHRRVHACKHSQMHVSTYSHHNTGKSSETVPQKEENCSLGDVLMTVV